MFTSRVWFSTVATVLIVLVAAGSLVYRFETVVEAVDPEIILKPPPGTGSGTFNYLDQAINDYIYDAAQISSAGQVQCHLCE